MKITKYLGYSDIESDNGDDLYMYVDVYESSSESSANFPEKTYPFPWEPIVAFISGDECLGWTMPSPFDLVSPMYKPMKNCISKKQPTSIGGQVDLSQNPLYEGPEYVPNGGPLNFWIRPGWTRTLTNKKDWLRVKWGLPNEGFEIIKPNPHATVKNMPSSCIAVYRELFMLGLRFSLRPFSCRAFECLQHHRFQIISQCMGLYYLFLDIMFPL